MNVAPQGEELYSWGWNQHGQLGHGTNERCVTIIKPIDRVLLQGQSVQFVSCGFCFNVALTKRGDIFTWGYNRTHQLGIPDQKEEMSVPRKLRFFQSRNVATIAAGRNHAIAVLRTGEVYSWGSGVYGVLGHGSEDSSFEPQQIKFFQRSSLDLNSSQKNIDTILVQLRSEDEEKNKTEKETQIRVISVACGASHNLALDDHGRVYSWGLGLLGRLGHGNQETQLEPRLIRTFAEQKIKIKIISCGWDHSAVISKRNGHVYTWGCGRSFQLGGVGLRSNGNNCAARSLFRKSDVDDAIFMERPVKVIQWQFRNQKSKIVQNCSSLPVIADLSCGGKHTIALTENGEVFTWGRGEFGRLGHRDQEHRVFPLMVTGFPDPIRAIAGGGYHSMAVTERGELYAWGHNEHGRLGLGSSQLFVTSPTLVNQTSASSKHRIYVSQIFAGAYMSVAVGGVSQKSGHGESSSNNSKCVLQ